MKASYVWGWQIDPEFKALTWDKLTYEEVCKKRYVNDLLSLSVNKAECGWYGVCYCVCEANGANRTEFVLMFADPNDTPRQARWINVTGNSKGAIAEAVWSLVFA